MNCDQCGWLMDKVCEYCSKKKQEHKVTFSFNSEEQLKLFMAQLSDGWGENYVEMKQLEDNKFSECRSFHVFVCQDYEDEFDPYYEDNDEDSE